MQAAEVCNTNNRVQVEEIDSNPYRNISMWVENERITIAGTKTSESILIHIAEINMKYKCLRCDYMSRDVMNVYAHVGYVHMGTYCTSCDTICFGSCPGKRTA